MSVDHVYIIDDSTLWDRFCVNKRPSKKMFEKIVEPHIAKLQSELSALRAELAEANEVIGFYARNCEDENGEDFWEGDSGLVFVTNLRAREYQSKYKKVEE
jgi:hypothetical protein